MGSANRQRGNRQHGGFFSARPGQLRDDGRVRKPFRHKAVTASLTAGVGLPSRMTQDRLRCMAPLRVHKECPQHLIDEARRINRHHISERFRNSSAARAD